MSSLCRYCQQVLNETVRTAKLTPIAARLQEVEGRVDGHIIPKEVSSLYSDTCVKEGIKHVEMCGDRKTINFRLVTVTRATSHHLVFNDSIIICFIPYL